MISTLSITNYHSEGPPIFNQKSSMESDLDPCRNQPASIVCLLFKILAQISHGTSRFIKP